jgi:hypothetical protein
MIAVVLYDANFLLLLLRRAGEHTQVPTLSTAIVATVK